MMIRRTVLGAAVVSAGLASSAGIASAEQPPPPGTSVASATADSVQQIGENSRHTADHAKLAADRAATDAKHAAKDAKRAASRVAAATANELRQALPKPAPTDLGLPQV